jgi:outer membrane protein OmpA-like peptidoglycan-associated protein
MKIFFSLLFLFLTSSGFAQHIIFQDNFDKESKNWYLGSNTSYSSSIKTGKFYAESFVGDNYSAEFVTPVNIDFHKDYTIEMEVAQYSNKDGHGYGIRWAYDYEEGNYYSFIINETGYYNIYKKEDKVFKDLKPWTQNASLVHKNGMINILKIENKNKRCSFYINNHKVYDTASFVFFGNDLGIEINNRMKVAMDKITVYQEQAPILLTPNLPKGIVKTRMSGNINSPYSELYPKISPDGKTLLFTRRDHPENMGTDKFISDTWYSELDTKTNTWGKAKNMGKPINNAGENYVISMTPDNNTLLVGNTYNKDGSSLSTGLSMSHRISTGWSLPETVIVKDLYNRNKYMDACLSVDRKILIYAIEMDDSFGEKDLYVCFLNKDNTWTHPKHLGSTINTYADDLGPFLASDRKTLYYSTSGKPGYGSNDIFVTKRLDDTWQKWSEPLNLGPDINTTDWDCYYTVAASGEFAFVTSTTEDNSEDIFMVKLPQVLKPDPVVLVEGKVFDAKTKKPIKAIIHYENLNDGKKHGFANSNSTTGEYKIVLPYDLHYGFHAEAEGYIAVNENIDLTVKGDHKVLHHDLYLVPIEIGQSIKLNNVFFVQSKPELLSIAYPELDRLAEVMKANPKIEIELSGHTDNVGDASKNLILSEQRVKTVKDYLVSKGISAARITGKGYGGTKPVSSGNTEEDKKLNRRVEFTITKK